MSGLGVVTGNPQRCAKTLATTAPEAQQGQDDDVTTVDEEFDR